LKATDHNMVLKNYIN